MGFALERLLNPIVEAESRAEEHILRCRVDVRDEGLQVSTTRAWREAREQGLRGHRQRSEYLYVGCGVEVGEATICRTIKRELENTHQEINRIRREGRVALVRSTVRRTEPIELQALSSLKRLL